MCWGFLLAPIAVENPAELGGTVLVNCLIGRFA